MRSFLELTLIDRYSFASSREVLINVHEIAVMYPFKDDDDGEGTSIGINTNKEIKVKESFEDIKNLMEKFLVK
jgi:hypothetical protein